MTYKLKGMWGQGQEELGGGGKKKRNKPIITLHDVFSWFGTLTCKRETPKERVKEIKNTENLIS